MTVFLGPILLTGVAFIVLGIIMRKYPPKHINYMYGYRTKNAMKSQRHWDFAQRYSAQQITLAGVLLCMLQPILFLIFKNLSSLNKIILSIIVIILVIVGYILKVENKIKKEIEDSNNGKK